MKRKHIILPLSILGILFLTGCYISTDSSSNSGTPSSSSSQIVISGSTVDVDSSEIISIEEVSVEDDSISSNFTLVDSNNNALTPTSGIYTITSAGTYKASGKLDSGQIKVNAPDADVTIELRGVSITSNSVSPIYATTCGTLKVKAINGYSNYIFDKRTTDYSQTSTSDGTAAIYADDGDLDLVGQGSLYVYSYQNSGIHGKDNVKVKNLTLVIRAQNNGIKGNDKVTIEEDPTIDIYADNNGIVTSKSDVGSNAQHGYIYLNGGSISINSNGDGIDAAYSIVTGSSTDSDGVTYTPTVVIYTGKYSAFYNSTASSYSAIKYAFGPGGNGGMGPGGGTSGQSSAEKSDDSAKGFKAANAITINEGNIYIQAYDDGLHANNDTLDSGTKGTGAVVINGGTVKVYASDDGAHADGTLSVTGGTLNIIASHEGVEGNTISISGGIVKVSPVYTKDSYGVSIATDDAINASNSLTISGGFVDTAVNPNGDYDCLDSNGALTISGGVVIARGPNSGMAGALDADGKITISGGTVVVCGSIEGGSQSISTSSKTITSVASSGSHTLTVDGTTYSFSNSYSYSTCKCYSNASNVSAS